MSSMVKGKTGDQCKINGKYYCEAHHDIVITVKKGELFPHCHYPVNPHEAIWILYLQF